MRKVSVIQREIPHYRIRFFEELYAQGRLQNLDIQVICAVPPTQRISSDFTFRVLPARYFGKSKSSPYWLYGLAEVIAGSDIVVAPQELQCLTVPCLWVKRKKVCQAWIWWGHGYNFQAAVRPSFVSNIKEAIKEFMTRRADGLITYTERGAEYWRKRGFPENRVKAYCNTIDVEELRKVAEEISEQQRLDIRRRLLLEGKHVLLFSGRLYADKKLDFLLRAFALLKRTRLDVSLLIVGDGEERDRLQQLAKTLELHDAHFLGEILNAKDAAAYFAIADLMVVPSLVGLVIVHGFAFGIPMITTNAPGHGPEIEYLSKDNGEATDYSEDAFAKAIGDVLSHSSRYEQMRKAAWAQADKLRIERSVGLFLHAAQEFVTI